MVELAGTLSIHTADSTLGAAHNKLSFCKSLTCGHNGPQTVPLSDAGNPLRWGKPLSCESIRAGEAHGRRLLNETHCRYNTQNRKSHTTKTATIFPKCGNHFILWRRQIFRPRLEMGKKIKSLLQNILETLLVTSCLELLTETHPADSWA